MNTKQKALLDDIYDATTIDMAYEVENNMPDNVDDFMGVLQDRVYEIEMIYYHKAMAYLLENDSSLQESMALAHGMGYTCENINSELLATLLLQQEAGNAIYTFKDEIESLFFNNETN